MAIRTLVCTDGSQPSARTLDYVIQLGKRIPLEPVLVHVIDLKKLEYRMIADMYLDIIREQARRAGELVLEREAARAREAGVDLETRLLEGSPGQVICRAAEELGAALVVLGRRGHSDMQDLLFGSISSHVVHHTDRPALVVKRTGRFLEEAPERRPIRCLLGMDGSDASERCLDALATIKEAAGGIHVTLIHVINPKVHGLQELPAKARYEALSKLFAQGEELLERGAERLRKLGFQVATRVEEGAVGKTLCRIYEEDEHDIVMVGRRGLKEASEMFVGSVSHHVMHHCAGHVLIVP
ncbi:MAG: universal stress protein [Deltaproteobacteria bacterium]|nr:universal stress protein [Deltaproteobacteria bacterium]